MDLTQIGLGLALLGVSALTLAGPTPVTAATGYAATAGGALVVVGASLVALAYDGRGRRRS